MNDNIQSAVSDWSNPPGLTVRAVLNKKMIGLSDFADRLGVSVDEVNNLLDGRIAIDALMAQDLERVIGGSVNFWLQREANYRSDKQKSADLNPDRWLETLPVKEMLQWGWISKKGDEVSACKKFFGISTVREWRIKYESVLKSSQFRRSSTSDSKSAAVSAWLRFSELQANEISCKSWSESGFTSSFEEIKKLTFERDPGVFIPKLREICAANGVALVIARAPSGSTVSGAAMFLSEEKAAICLSFRHLSDDHLWFTFFHEAGHLVLHRKSLPFVDNEETRAADVRELEANDFAAKTILPDSFKTALIQARNNKFSIVRIANKLNVCAGLLVGQLQKGGYIPYNRMNSLKRRYSWTSLGTQ